MKKETWKTVIQVIVSILTATLTALGTTSCMGHGHSQSEQKLVNLSASAISPTRGCGFVLESATLTSSNWLTLGIAQASLALLSLNRHFATMPLCHIKEVPMSNVKHKKIPACNLQVGLLLVF